MSEQQQIDEILLEANAYGLKKEVEDTAKQKRLDITALTKLGACKVAYNEWIKNKKLKI